MVSACKQLLRKLLVEVLAMVNEWSPGSCLQHFFLSYRELAKLSAAEKESESLTAPEVQYSQARVDKARRESKLVTEEIQKGNEPEELNDLFLLPDEGGGKF